ncbi:cupin domain-containing protein [Sphingobium sp. WCS2017Hpa-17]|uniref:cupin domain-containing protein n=1 Tax=Sphingobium sp. WCS2017Hpa-17 TaxID=3073638 RepID=UPI0028896EF5|nr:cupin domain-containing protein [Sphingobium sp. WCS2017Hpa-17]
MDEQAAEGLGNSNGIHVAIAQEKTLPRIPGRRDWVEFLDYGVTQATAGRMRVQRAMVIGQPEATGWHYHLCEMQFVYLLGGGYTLQFEDGRTVRLERGDSILIPGGCKHSEIDIAPDFDVLEISIPADMGTRTCEVPEYWRANAS